ncbi:MAG: carboxypeptidase-like regulatory domain-containing protein [Flavobacteriales bacterium]|nr:carboxypeptidase-like regulatory domain-containing protein [Flavobacteriales bacterium]
MKILAFGLSALFIAIGVMLRAQPSLLSGVVLDSETNQPLSGAHISIPGTDEGEVSDAEGRFSLNVRRGVDVQLRITYTGFTELKQKVPAKEVATGEVLLLRLARGAILLDPTEVRARIAPEVVFKRPDLHVGGYLANADGLWVLAYSKPQLWHSQADAGQRVMQAARLVLLDTLLREMASIGLPDDARAMHCDHGGRPVVEGAREGWIARREGDLLALGRLDRETLREAVLPWTDSLGGKLLGNNRNEAYPAFEHFARDLKTNKDQLLCTVQDDFMIELFRSQYKYMSGPDKVIAMDLEIETGIDRELIAGFMTGFHKDLYFKVPYAPLFVVRDTLCVFDHAKERIRRFMAEGTAVAEVKMRHAAERHWAKTLIQDQHSGQVYALFRQGPRTWLRSVDVRDGSIGAPSMLVHPFPEDVQVHEGHAYYVYRPHGSTQKRTLYRERLR